MINALSNLYHPCQTVADLQSIRETKKRLKGLKIAWIGDGNNVCNSLLIGAALAGCHVSVASPENYEPFPEALAKAKDISKITGSAIEVTESSREAIRDSDVVVTDTFISMGDEDERKERLEIFLPNYQVNQELFSKAKPNAVFMHCLPAHRGEEVTSDVIDGPHSIIWRETENRLHAQKAILYNLMSKVGPDYE